MFLSYTIFLDFIWYHLLHINNVFYTIICLFNNVLVTAYGVPLFFGMDWELPVDLKKTNIAVSSLYISFLNEHKIFQ